jgi:copper homeostasis protein
VPFNTSRTPSHRLMDVSVEICAEGVSSALAAGLGGANRVELCENLAVGGVTPGAGAVAVASERLSIPVHVLIRPRGGDFIYSDDELLAMKRDVQAAKGLGASGVVFGFLTKEGRVDHERTAWLAGLARPMRVTFHKVFDAARDPFEALDDLIGMGIDRVLTSGSASTAIEGLSKLGELTRRAAGRIAVMAGGSITLAQVLPIIGSGVKEIHLGSAACSGGVVDAGLVRRIVEEASMKQVYHITTRAEWELALEHGSYRPPSLATEGFIHASTAGQLAGTLHRFFQGREGLILLRIDLDRVAAPIDWASSPHSTEPFPHILGELNLDAVTGSAAHSSGPDGESAWPFDDIK